MNDFCEKLSSFVGNYSLSQFNQDFHSQAFWVGVISVLLILLVIQLVALVLKIVRQPKFPGIAFNDENSSVIITHQALKSLVREQLNSLNEIAAHKIVFSQQKDIIHIAITISMLNPQPINEVKDKAYQALQTTFSSLGINDQFKIELIINNFETEAEANSQID